MAKTRLAVRTNGATLSYKKKSESTYTVLEGLQSIPEIGSEPEKIECTVLTSKNKLYVKGIGDVPEMAYTFLFLNDEATSAFRVLSEMEKNEEVVEFKHALEDGTEFTFSGQVSIKISGGEVNGVITFTATITVGTDIVRKDPAGA